MRELSRRTLVRRAAPAIGTIIVYLAALAVAALAVAFIVSVMPA